MTNEEHKKFMAELRRQEDANLQIAMAISLVDLKPENPILEELWCEKADPPVTPKEITDVLGQLTPEEFRDL